MLILPPGHGKAVANRRPLSTRERRMIGSVLAVVAAVAIALVISFADSGKTSAHGCIYATIPGPVGAQEVDQCGARARETCRSAPKPGEFTPQAAHVIEQQCRKAGLPVGS